MNISLFVFCIMSISFYQVRSRGGSYIKAQLVENGILVNIGDLMQRWTADQYLAVVSGDGGGGGGGDGE